MNVETLKLYNTLDLSERQLPLITVKGQAEGAKIWLVATAHGNELTGIEVIHRVLAILKNLPLQRGTLYAMPLLNPMANELLQRNTPQDNENLNRAYPGSPTGSFTDRLAHTIYQAILERGADAVLDLHTMAVSRTLPFVILDRPHDPTRQAPLEALADIFGLTVVYDYPLAEYAAQNLDGCLSGTLLNRDNILSYTVEIGPANILQPTFVEAGVQGVLNILNHFDMLPHEHQYHPTRQTRPYRLRRDSSLRATHTGILEYLVQPGDSFAAGQPLVRIKNILGETVSMVSAPQEGFVLTLSERAIAFPGIQLMQLAIKEDAT